MKSPESHGFDGHQKGIRKSLVAGTIGVFVHWFDWAIYAYLSATLAQVFFPQKSDTAALLAVFAVLAVSFAVRPIGAFIFGYVGDRLGRKKTLSIVILVMAAGTLILGLLPSFGSIGVWAPILLVAVRIIQGLAAGGEFGSAAAFLAEYSPSKRRGFGVSWLEVGSLLGFLAASLVVYALTVSLTSAALLDWGWRIPFLLTAPLGLIGYYIRLKIEDTPEFNALLEEDSVSSSPLTEVIGSNWREMLKCGGIETMMHVTFYIVLVYLLVYQEQFLGWTASRAAILSGVASVIAAVLIPLFGHLSDRWGRRTMLFGASVALMVLSYPAFVIMRFDALWAGVVSTITLGIILAIILGVHAVTSAELFPTRTRQSGLSIAYNVTSAIFAGTVPFVLTWLISVTGNIMFPAFYLMLMGILGFITIMNVKESRGIDLMEKDRALTATDVESTPNHSDHTRVSES